MLENIYKKIIQDQLPEIPKENFILEPEMRDVGAAVGLVAAVFEKIADRTRYGTLSSLIVRPGFTCARDIMGRGRDKG